MGPAMARILSLQSVTIQQQQLRFQVTLDGHCYNTEYRYHDCDFDDLQQRYSKATVEQLCFHIIAFEMIKYCCLAPELIDFGPYRHYCQRDFYDLWQHMGSEILMQWRFENHRADYIMPQPIHGFFDTGETLTEIDFKLDYLVFCGGGKDSLLSMRVMDHLQEPYATMIYSHSIYGHHAHQQQLIHQLSDHCSASTRHMLEIDDDFFSTAGMAHLAQFNIKEALAAETPCSIFAALPIAFAKQYRCAVLGHERSADSANFIWPETGLKVNHQWGKSWQAETRLNNYIRRHLLADFNYFSILKPLNDVAIFGLLQNHQDAVFSSHSCNIDKPWCKQCAKCCYVWLGFKAYFDNQQVDALFAEDLFDNPENLIWFRQLLGLEQHTPFECVGQVDEARIALALYLQHNENAIAQELSAQYDFDIDAAITELTQPDYQNSNLDARIKPRLKQYLDLEAHRLQQRLRLQIQEMPQYTH